MDRVPFIACQLFTRIFKAALETKCSSWQRLRSSRKKLLDSLLSTKANWGISFGAPQPVFWHTVFHSPFFHKVANYLEVASVKLDQETFDRAVSENFVKWKLSRQSVFTEGGFTQFDTNIAYRGFLLELFKPTTEVQRWVNDAALKLKLASRNSGMSSLAASETDESYAHERLSPTSRKKSIPVQVKPAQEMNCDASKPKTCEAKMQPLPCKTTSCETNIAIHIRLQDGSSSHDYWSERDLATAKRYINARLKESERRVVVFSNDLRRALSTGDELSKNISSTLQYSESIDVVEFFLMSQYFGTHLLTPAGSTFQMWALFLSELDTVKVVALPESNDYGLSKKLPHLNFEILDYT